MSDTLQALNGAAEAIWLASHDTWPGLSAEVLPEVGSTNAELMARGRAGQTSPTVLMAASQTAGRGRLGRSWLAEPGRSLTVSIGLPLALDSVPGGGSALSLVVGCAVAQALSAHLPEADTPRHGLGLKWPNDLLWQGRKLGGILIEATPSAGLPAGQRWVVIGLGLNVRPRAHAAPWPVATLDEAWRGPAPDVGRVASVVVPAILAAVPAFITSGFAPWQAAFGCFDVLSGQDVSLHPAGVDAAQPSAIGSAQGVDGSGALLVHTAQGLLTCTSGEVSVRAAALGHLPPVSNA